VPLEDGLKGVVVGCGVGGGQKTDVAGPEENAGD